MHPHHSADLAHDHVGVQLSAQPVRHLLRTLWRLQVLHRDLYVAPIGGYSAPGGAYQAPQPPAPKRATMGIIAFALSLVAAVVAPIFGGIAGYQIGAALPALADSIDAATSDLSFLSPVRDQVLIGELGFWGGTLAGIAAIVFGIIAIAKRQGRAWGVVALILGVVAPVIFFTALSVMLGSGTSVGFLAQ